MNLPFFYISDYDPSQKEIVLDEDTSRHVVQVLRMKIGEQLNLTDGKGSLLTCKLIEEHKKHCRVQQLSISESPAPKKNISIAVSLLKNPSRFEWFLEKATEIGVTEIIPLICKRTEKEKFRYDRMQQVCISAMLQSKRVWLPILHEPMQFGDISSWKSTNAKHFIAHCNEEEKQPLSNLTKTESSQILIGPEGDFTNAEIELALENGFIPVSLGESRLRTETAALVAAVLLSS